MLVCWVEDDDGPYNTFMETIKSKEKEEEFRIMRFNNFEEASKRLPDYNYSLLILDLRDADANERSGDVILREIFEKTFKPTIIYSAVEPQDVGNEDARKHPLIKYVQKKSGSDLTLLEELEKFKSKVSFLEKVKSTIDNINFQLLKNTFPIIEEDSLPEDVMERLFARRIAASLDFAFHLAEGTKIDPCEMYLYPPLPNTDLLTGDIIKNKDGCFYVVLSPSCDMAQLGGRKNNVDEVLVAKLEEIKAVMEDAPYFKNKTDPKTLAEAVKKQRDKEPNEGKIYFPRLNKSLPGFRVDLKKLKLISISSIDFDLGDSKEFFRVASMDSPFRESFSTLAGQEMGRFGLPDFDYEKWGKGYWDVHPGKVAEDKKQAEVALAKAKKNDKAGT